MDRVFYIATFHYEDNGYWVSFVDFPECFSQGETLEEAFNMAVEALELCIEDRINNNELIPIATVPKDINVGNDKMVLIPYSNHEKRVA